MKSLELWRYARPAKVPEIIKGQSVEEILIPNIFNSASPPAFRKKALSRRPVW